MASTRSERNKAILPIKARHEAYLTALSAPDVPTALRVRFRNLRRKLQNLLRKEHGSFNSLKTVPNLTRIIFGLQEDIFRLSLPGYSLEQEKAVLNRALIHALDERLNTKYDGYGTPAGPISFGESLLNAYLDVFITFTVLGTPKAIGSKPAYLLNPTTGQPLEIDIEFEDFHLAFEYQGHAGHFVDDATMRKDLFKLGEFSRHSRILIPVNAIQLQGSVLQDLIANTIKDHAGLHHLLVRRDPTRLAQATGVKHRMVAFSKVVQRLFLARTILRETIEWIDAKSSVYVSRPLIAGSLSASMPAPRLHTANADIPLSTMYGNLKHVTAARRNRS